MSTPVALTYIAVDYGRACGLTASNGLYCTRNIATTGNVTWVAIETPDSGATGMYSIKISADSMCGLTSIIRHQAKCAPFMTNARYHPGGWVWDVMHGISSGNRYCGVNADSWYWFGYYRNPLDISACTYSTSSMSHCDMSGNRVCFRTLFVLFTRVARQHLKRYPNQ